MSAGQFFQPSIISALLQFSMYATCNTTIIIPIIHEALGLNKLVLQLFQATDMLSITTGYQMAAG